MLEFLGDPTVIFILVSSVVIADHFGLIPQINAGAYRSRTFMSDIFHEGGHTRAKEVYLTSVGAVEGEKAPLLEVALVGNDGSVTKGYNFDFIPGSLECFRFGIWYKRTGEGQEAKFYRMREQMQTEVESLRAQIDGLTIDHATYSLGVAENLGKIKKELGPVAVVSGTGEASFAMSQPMGRQGAMRNE